MTEKLISRLRLYLTTFVVLLEMAHLTWEHFNGGIISHHLLHREELPAISNWWGLLLLPVLTWFLAGRIQRRIDVQSQGKDTTSMVLASVVTGFIVSLMFGILLSLSFTHGYENTTSYLFLGMVLVAFLVPIYRAEYLLGFVMGMNFTFGAVLPTLIGSIIAALSGLIHHYVIPGLVRLWTWLKRRK